ncbi:hypothetical protein [Pseudomonas sp. TH15]|uniref:hypothetical protein n=1 Tax=Pseudomonas sp. TH15 TaxID=2796381 RepID=UPI00191249EC|nr:hypothetical protein [Pseudomonas sp. TH15]MBK5511529.1 hypothetical protein [Pseudomonas sp. TH15]
MGTPVIFVVVQTMAMTVDQHASRATLQQSPEYRPMYILELPQDAILPFNLEEKIKKSQPRQDQISSDTLFSFQSDSVTGSVTGSE